MTQKVRATSTVSAGGFVPTGAATVHEATSETTASDTEYASVPNSDLAPMRLALGDITLPVGAGDITVRYRLISDDGSIAAVRLYQGATLIAEWLHDPVPVAWTTITQTLTGPQAAAITDGTDLEIEFAAAQDDLPLLMIMSDTELGGYLQ